MGGGKGQILSSLFSQAQSSQSQPSQSSSPPAGGPPGQSSPGQAAPSASGKQPFKAEVQMGQQPAVPEIIVNVISPQGKGIPAKAMMGSILTNKAEKSSQEGK
jgi:hypothetical protein